MPGASSELRLTLASTRAEVGRALDEVRGFLMENGADDEAIDALCLTVDEVVANVVLHGYGEDGDGSVALLLAIGSDAYELEVRDEAPAFDPLSAAPPHLDDDPELRGIGGLGMHLVRTLMDELSYERSGGENVLRLRRLLVRPEGS